MRALGVEADPAPRFEEEGRKLVLADQRAAFLPGAGTAVLRHVERYGIDERGLVHFLQYDLRRVSGTTDVAQGATAFSANIEGRSAPRLLRKRIHKRDGRILEPDAAANASQASDLSQLEQGDYVEQIVEGWALPGDTGQILIDTPDLLPERTSMREATIEVRRAASIPFAIWAHPLLGAPEEKTDGDFKVSTWRLKDQAPRRIEDGIPKMERSVAVSLGTQTWAQIARAFEETIRSLDEHDPRVVRWVAEAAGADRTPGKALVDRVVAAAGKKIKVAGGGELSDMAAVYAGGAQRTTARTILELGQGSRSWVVYRALRELGIPADLAVAETEPFSAVPTFPAHVGRFRHPLVVAHLGAAGGDVWIDADVEGPPLPPGASARSCAGAPPCSTAARWSRSRASPATAATRSTSASRSTRRATPAAPSRCSSTGAPRSRSPSSSRRWSAPSGRAMLRGVVLGWLPWADVDDVAVSSSDGSWEVALRASIAVHGMGRPEGKDGKTWVLAGLEPVHVVFPRGAVGTLGASYASRGARQNALSIEMPLQYHFHRVIELPPGASVVHAAAAVAVTDPNISARREIQHQGNRLEEDFRLSLPTGTVAAGRYQAFVGKVQAIDDGFMAGTRDPGGRARPRPQAPREVISLDLREHAPLAPRTTLGAGGPARWLVEADREAEVAAALAWARERALPTLVLGGGSNLLVADRGFDGLVLCVRAGGLRVEARGSAVLVEAGAGERWDRPRGARRERGVGGRRVPLRHPRRRGRHADPERRRLRAGGGRDHHLRARPRSRHGERGGARPRGLRLRLPRQRLQA